MINKVIPFVMSQGQKVLKDERKIHSPGLKIWKNKFCQRNKTSEFIKSCIHQNFQFIEYLIKFRQYFIEFSETLY